MKRLLGKRFLEERAARLAYAYDASGLCFVPEAVALPQELEEVKEILRLAYEERFPVIPRGAGTATTGAPLAAYGGLVLALTKMNRILEINTEDLIAVVEPGVINGEFRQAVEERGLFYPPDPASYEFSSLGGNVATCAGGPKGLKYGVTKDYVLGLEVVLPSGESIFCGRRTVKGVVGYDLVHLFVGSEGTLGVITKIILKLLPKPKARGTILAGFADLTLAVRGFSALLKKGLLPATAELLDDVTLEAVARFLGKRPSAQALLLLDFDGGKAQVQEDLEEGLKSLAPYALFLEKAQDEPTRTKLWQARKNVSPALKSLAPGKIADDVVVTRSQIPKLIQFIKQAAQETGLKVACFGHLGDGNLHVNILFDPQKDLEQAQKLREEILAHVLSLSGTISGEHGIGLTKRAYLPQELSPKLIELMQGLKNFFDPRGILNPGKIF